MTLGRSFSLLAAASVALLGVAAPSQAQDAMAKQDKMAKKEMAGGKMMSAHHEGMMRGWPKASMEAARAMTAKYGAPKHMTEHTAMWEKTGPWKRTVVYNYEVQHNFPAPHTDVMEQWIDYRVPADKFSDLAEFDGSVVVNRTGGEISARCDLEPANLLALNLSHEIVQGKRSVSDARKMYGEQIMAFKAGKPAPYAETLMISMMTGTMDPDHP